MNDWRKTLVFFSLIKQPLTLLELSRWKHSLTGTMNDCMKECASHATQEGLYETRQQWTARRIQADHAKHVVWKRVHGFVKFIQSNPFIVAVAVANSAAFNNVTDNSDVDVCIITKKNRAWLARLLVALPARLLRLRPGECDRAPICLSFFVDEEHLNLKPLTLKKDIYFAHWMDSLIWIHDPHAMRYRCAKENSWAATTLNRPLNISHTPLRIHVLARAINVCLNILNNRYMERLAFRIQKKYLPRKLTESSHNPSGVYMTPSIIKMHLDDKRESIKTSYEQLCASNS